MAGSSRAGHFLLRDALLGKKVALVNSSSHACFEAEILYFVQDDSSEELNGRIRVKDDGLKGCDRGLSELCAERLAIG